MGDYRIAREPRGELLGALLQASLADCDRFLVALSDMELTSRATEVLRQLQPFLMSRSDEREYPAGVLPWGTITICTYHLNQSSVAVLAEATDRLFRWLEPGLPNELCLMDGDRPWLTTMASDRIALMTLSDDERERLLSKIPGLELKRVDG